jgi:tetratricopeptide (TPR) repeat protein
LHRRIAEVLEIQRPHDVVALAHHYARAAADGDAAKGIEFATKAAQLAASRLAHDEAAELYGEALALLNETDEPARRCELLIRRGIALRLSGDTSHRRTLLDAAELAVSIGDTDRLTRAALANNRGFASASGEVDVERVLVLEAALKAVGPTDSAARARLLATLAAELTYAGDWARRLSLSDEALAMARRIDEAATLSHVLTARHYSIAVPEMLEERLRNTAEHLETSTLVSDPIDRFYALWTRAWSCLEAGDIDEANRCDTDAEEIADQVGVPLLRHLAIGRRSRRALLDGNLAEAERLAFEALRLGLSGGERDAELNFGCQMFSIRYEQGRLGDLEPAISQAVGENPGLPTIRAYLAVCLSEIGRDREAHTMLHRELAGDFAGFSYDQTWVNALALYAGACARLRDAESAAALYEKLEPWARQVTTINGMVVNGAVAHHLGALASTLDRYDDADAWFSNAAVIHDRVRAPIWSAHTKVQWSDALLRRNRNGDRTRARALLADAGATAEELGVAAIAQHIALISHTV